MCIVVWFYTSYGQGLNSSFEYKLQIKKEHNKPRL
jgi:hypothetical protein